jgi:hypothetical protein
MPVSRKRRSKGSRTKRSPGRDPRSALIRETARYPIRECLINKDWREQKMASITFARTRPDGSIAYAAFAVDVGCLGVKSALANPSITEREYLRSVDHLVEANGGVMNCEPALAVKLIKGAYEYAAKLGFKPDPDYFYSREIFGTIDAESCGETIEYGNDGKPFYLAGPYDDIEKVLARLTRTLGPDGFQFIAPLEFSED